MDRRELRQWHRGKPEGYHLIWSIIPPIVQWTGKAYPSANPGQGIPPLGSLEGG